MEEKVNTILMLEILGKPKEHVKKILSEIVGKLIKEKNVKLINKKIAEPKLVEGQEDIFSSFAEVEVETSLQVLMLLIFGYMPSHIEIIEPENLKLSNNELNIFLNELTRKLHQYDELAKGLLLERQALAKQIQEQIKEGKIKIVKEGDEAIKKEKAENKKKGKKRKKK